MDSTPKAGPGRPKKYESDAARQAAYRKRHAPVLIAQKRAATLDAIAGELDCSRNELVDSMIQFALMNRKWRQLGLFGSRTWSTENDAAT